MSTVLFVEDDHDARTSLVRTLTAAGHRVFAAHSPEAALAALPQGLFIDIVVTDVFLGHEATGGLRLLGELRTRSVDAPVVLITAFAAIESVKSALNEGAAFLLEKPFRARELLDVIHRILSAPPASLTYVVDRALSQLSLTEKEQAIARYVLKGLTSSEIARLELNSDKTIRQHITRIYAKCGVTSRAEFFHHVFPW